MARMRMGPVHRMCYVCGHDLGPYMRICDKCGNIQRPVGGDGLPIPPDQIGSCQYCGLPIPADETFCTTCLQKESGWPEGPIFIEESGEADRKIKVVAATAGSVSLGAVGASIWGLVALGGAAWLIAIICLAGVGLVLSLGSLMRVYRKPKLKIEVLKPIKPGDQK